MSTVNVRDIAIDNLKTFAIVLVVLGHSLQYLIYPSFNGPENEYKNYLFRIIYIFHMPMFIFISGMFHKNSEGLIDFIRKWCFRLIIPMFLWGGVNNIFQLIFVDDFKITYQTFLHSFLYDYWFIWCLFECKMFLYMMKYVRNRHAVIFIVVLAYFLPMPIPRYNFFLSLLPFYAMGYYLKLNRTKMEAYLSVKNVFIISLAIIISVLSTVIWNQQYSIYASSYGLLRMLEFSTYVDFIVRVLGGLSYIILCFIIFYRWIKMPNYMTSLFGKITLGVYLLQYAYTKLLRIYPLSFNSMLDYFIMAFIFSAICLFISYTIILCLQKNRWSNHYLLGNL